jgi:YetF C-terminal domain
LGSCRAVLLAILLAILVAGAIGLLGIRSRTAEASADGYDLQVHYASIARLGVEVRDGTPLDEVLRAERLTLDEVAGAARDQGIDDLRRVRVGILEPEGKFSFLIDHGPMPQQRVGQQENSASGPIEG